MIKKVFREMLIAQILSSVTVMICMLIDSIMIGRFLGVDAMTAYGLSAPVLLIFAAVGSVISAGVQVMCGKTMGSADKEGTNTCYSTAVTIGASIAICGLFLVLIFSRPLTTLLGAGDPTPGNSVFKLTRDYLCGYIIGTPAVVLAQIAVPFLQISGKRSRLALAVSVLTLADITFNSLNVFVFHGGTYGMGLASGLSYYIALFVGAGYFISKKCIFRFSFRNVKPRAALMLFKHSTPTIVNQLSFVLLIFTLNNILLGVAGTHAVAAYSVIYSIGNLCYSVGAGIGAVSMMLSSIFYTDEDRTSLRTLVKTMTFYAFVLDFILIIVIILIAPSIVSLYLTRGSPVRRLTVFGLRLFSLSLLASSINSSFKQYFQGVNRALFTETISVLQNFVFVSIYSFILSRFIGTTGVWISFLFGETTTLLFLVITVWIANRKITLSEDAFLMLRPDFGVAANDLLEISAQTPEEAESMPEKALDFCMAHGENEEDCEHISRCIGEMVHNIVTHGFGADEKAHIIDLRVMFKKDKSRVIRIRDNCRSFDPVNYLENHSENGKDSGIAMVMSLAKDANYVNSLGLNNLTLVF